MTSEAERIIFIEDYSPHLCVPTLDGNAHVLPVSLVRDWISGKRDMFNEDNRAVIQKILDEWLEITTDA